MTSKAFQKVLDEVFARVGSVLGGKAEEYANDDDRLANFKTAAALKHKSVPEVLSGMMVKHTVSIYDMVETGKIYPIEKWDEKIIDHINYLILLRAVLVEAESTTKG